MAGRFHVNSFKYDRLFVRPRLVPVESEEIHEVGMTYHSPSLLFLRVISSVFIAMDYSFLGEKSKKFIMKIYI